MGSNHPITKRVQDKFKTLQSDCQCDNGCDCAESSPAKLAPIVAAIAPVVAGKVMDKVLK